MECLIGEQNAYDLYRKYGRALGRENIIKRIRQIALLIATSKNDSDALYNVGRMRVLAHSIGFSEEMSKERYNGEYEEYMLSQKTVNRR